MLTEVFFTDFFVIEHSEVVAAVERKAYEVEDDKVCVQTHDTVSLEIHQNLRIKGQGPEEEIDPSNDTVDNLEILRSYYFDIKSSKTDKNVHILPLVRRLILILMETYDT